MEKRHIICSLGYPGSLLDGKLRIRWWQFWTLYRH